jgi:hypothetical protein
VTVLFAGSDVMVTPAPGVIRLAMLNWPVAPPATGQAAPPLVPVQLTDVQFNPALGVSLSTEPSAALGPPLVTEMLYTVLLPAVTAETPFDFDADRLTRGEQSLSVGWAIANCPRGSLLLDVTELTIESVAETCVARKVV